MITRKQHGTASRDPPIIGTASCAGCRIRAPRARCVRRPRYVDAGYFDDLDAAAKAAAGADAAGCSGVYVTLNPVMPALLARANNRLIPRPKHTTSDQEILPGGGCCSILTATVPVASQQPTMNDWPPRFWRLTSRISRTRGWSYPIICDSGNGHYLLYRVDLPNDAQVTEMIKSIYLGVQTLLTGTYHAHIDVGVFNPARIIRVGGTTNRKGDDTADRPHRLCRYNPPIDECPVEVISWA